MAGEPAEAQDQPAQLTDSMRTALAAAEAQVKKELGIDFINGGGYVSIFDSAPTAGNDPRRPLLDILWKAMDEARAAVLKLHDGTPLPNMVAQATSSAVTCAMRLNDNESARSYLSAASKNANAPTGGRATQQAQESRQQELVAKIKSKKHSVYITGIRGPKRRQNFKFAWLKGPLRKAAKLPRHVLIHLEWVTAKKLRVSVDSETALKKIQALDNKEIELPEFGGQKVLLIRPQPAQPSGAEATAAAAVAALGADTDEPAAGPASGAEAPGAGQSGSPGAIHAQREDAAGGAAPDEPQAATHEGPTQEADQEAPPSCSDSEGSTPEFDSCYDSDSETTSEDSFLTNSSLEESPPGPRTRLRAARQSAAAELPPGPVTRARATQYQRAMALAKRQCQQQDGAPVDGDSPALRGLARLQRRGR